MTALFYLLLFLTIGGTLLCVQVRAKSIATSSNSGDGFKIFQKDEKISEANQPDGKLKAEDVTAKEYYSPVFVSTNDFFVALAGVNRSEKADEHIDIITKYIKQNELLNKKDDITGTSSKWKKQFAVQKKGQSGVGKIVKGLLAVAAGNKIYLLLVNHTKKTPDNQNSLDITFSLSVGAVNDGEGKPEKKIVWVEQNVNFDSVTNKLKQKFGEEQLDIFFFCWLSLFD